jgi:two-component system chemotaxis response regulator CheV
VRVPPHFIAGATSGLVSAVTELDDGTLVMMLDVEQLLAETEIAAESGVHPDIGTKVPAGRTVLFADDSAVARTHIARTLDALAIAHIGTSNGMEAWTELTRIAADAKAHGRRVRDAVQLVLTDIEMPEMDGYMLAKRIRSDPRFIDVPVVMHSSLSGTSNRQLAQSVGIDEYISKFEPSKLAEILVRRLA